MRDDNQCRLFFGRKPHQKLGNIGTGFLIKTCSRLIGHDHARLRKKRTRDSNALHLTARQRFNMLLGTDYSDCLKQLKSACAIITLHPKTQFERQ